MKELEKKWFLTISAILIVVGAIFSVFGLDILPVINQAVLVKWTSAIYGAIMIGWGTTLFLIGKRAFEKKDEELKKIIFTGITIWLSIEAVFSLYLGVYFNVGVDIAVFLLFAIPLKIRNQK